MATPQKEQYDNLGYKSQDRNRIRQTMALTESYRNTPAITILRTVHRTSQFLLDNASEAFADSGLPTSELDAIFTLGNTDGMRMSDIAARMLTTAPNVTRVIKNLETRGLVRRCINPKSERETIASLTPEGEAIFAEYYPRAYRATRDLINGCLTDAQQLELIRLLEKITAK